VNENEDGNGKKRFFKLKNKTVKYGENEPKKETASSFVSGSGVHSKTHHMIYLFVTKNQS
jgi:hypothetical protein